MIVTTDIDEKIKLLDRFITSISVSEVKELVEKQEVVARLAGKDTGGMSPIMTLLNENNYLRSEVMNLRTDLNNVRTDFQALLKVLNQTMYAHNQDFYNLKQKHNVY
jgi:Mg-chelatase subunit ChlI